MVISSILFGTYIIDDAELQVREGLFESIEEAFYCYVYEIPIVPICLTVGMCYIFRNKTKIMFICSFIPCVFVFLFGVISAFNGISLLGESLTYGFGGFWLGIFIASFLCYCLNCPVIPICIVFQIICIIRKLKNKIKNKTKKRKF